MANKADHTAAANIVVKLIFESDKNFKILIS